MDNHDIKSSPVDDKVEVEVETRTLHQNPLNSAEAVTVNSATDYRLYKRRFSGITAIASPHSLCQVILAIITDMPWPWFGPIANNMVTDLGITLDEVNWLGILMAVIYLPVSLSIPEIIRRWGIRRCCEMGAAASLISAWIRYAGTGSFSQPLRTRFFKSSVPNTSGSNKTPDY
ncbi:hypothetical protein B0H11DRAFT_1928573 [Mycena galericulata]|nr:hypothetical protein B0H11DRAFT_1928573 [Mycena galericulata]